MLVKMTTPKSLAEATAALEAAVAAHGFGIMHVHNLKETMAKKGVDFPRECRVFEVCQPHHAKSVLEENMGVSTALPCRISLYEENGQRVFATLRPTELLKIFEVPDLAPVATEVESKILQILHDATA